MSWSTAQLEKLCSKIGSGSTPRGGNKSYKTNGIALVRSMNVHNGRFKLDNLAFIDEAQAAKLNNVVLEANDILLNITGASVARSCTLDNSALPARVNQHVCILRPEPKKLNYQYLMRFLTSEQTQKELLHIAGAGATREAITKAQIQNFPVPLPPLDEQKRLAEILDVADALRAKRRESLYQLDTFLYSTFLDLFGDTATNPDFRSVALTDIVTKFVDYRGKTPEKSHVGVPLITAKIVKNKEIMTPNEFIPEDSFDTRMSRGIPNPGDVIFTTEAPMGEVALVPEYKAAFGQRLVVLQPNAEKVESTYLMWALTMPFVIRQLQQRSTGSTVTGIRSKEFKKVNLLLPPINLQHRFAAIAESVERQKAYQRAHLDELDTLFASLQSRAFKGEL
jgi:type I restriction enzyme, S subunit